MPPIQTGAPPPTMTAAVTQKKTSPSASSNIVTAATRLGCSLLDVGSDVLGVVDIVERPGRDIDVAYMGLLRQGWDIHVSAVVGHGVSWKVHVGWIVLGRPAAAAAGGMVICHESAVCGWQGMRERG